MVSETKEKLQKYCILRRNLATSVASYNSVSSVWIISKIGLTSKRWVVDKFLHFAVVFSRAYMYVHTTTSAQGSLRPATKAGIQLYSGAKLNGHPSQTNRKSLDNVHDANDQANGDRVNNCELRYI